MIEHVQVVIPEGRCRAEMAESDPSIVSIPSDQSETRLMKDLPEQNLTAENAIYKSKK